MLKLLFLVAYPNINGPLPKILPILLGQLVNFNCEIHQAFWSRHSDHESISEKIIGRFHDILQIRKQLHKTPIDMLVITTTHDWMAILRDLPLLLVMRSLCPKIVIHFHGSHSKVIRSLTATIKVVNLVYLITQSFATFGQDWFAWSIYGRYMLVFLHY